MTKDERKKLRELALAATPGTWKVGDKGVGFRHISAPGVCIGKTYRREPMDKPNNRPVEGHENAEYIAAANPQSTLSLLDELEKLEQFIEERDWILKRAGAE